MSDRAELLARHVSPDGALIWRVERETEPDGRQTVSFGFEGLPWHLHPETFAANGRTAERIALDVTASLIGDRHIVVTRREGGETEHGLLETIELELELWGAYADLEFRFWSGRRVARAELLEGSVIYEPLGEMAFLRPE